MGHDQVSSPKRTNPKYPGKEYDYDDFGICRIPEYDEHASKDDTKWRVHCARRRSGQLSKIARIPLEELTPEQEATLRAHNWAHESASDAEKEASRQDRHSHSAVESGRREQRAASQKTPPGQEADEASERMVGEYRNRPETRRDMNAILDLQASIAKTGRDEKGNAVSMTARMRAAETALAYGLGKPSQAARPSGGMGRLRGVLQSGINGQLNRTLGPRGADDAPGDQG
jgi:hypothetical protein